MHGTHSPRLDGTHSDMSYLFKPFALFVFLPYLPLLVYTTVLLISIDLLVLQTDFRDVAYFTVWRYKDKCLIKCNGLKIYRYLLVQTVKSG